MKTRCPSRYPDTYTKKEGISQSATDVFEVDSFVDELIRCRCDWSYQEQHESRSVARTSRLVTCREFSHPRIMYGMSAWPAFLTLFPVELRFDG